MAEASSSKFSRSMKWFGGERVRVQLALGIVQVGYAGYYVLTKLAMSGDGVNVVVFAVYRDCIAIALLTPVAYFAERRVRAEYPLTWPTCWLILGLGITGMYLMPILFLVGLAFTNPTFAAAMQNATPVFTFLLAVVCQVEVIRFRKIDGIAKVAGVVACVAGAATMSIYKGPKLLGKDPEPSNDSVLVLGQQLHVVQDEWLTSALLSVGIDRWQLGSLCLIANCFSISVYKILQIPTLRRFPAPVSLTTHSMIVGNIFVVITGILTVSDASQWVITRPGPLIAVAYAAIIASGFNFTLQTWANHRGGPVLVAIYVPLQTVISAVLGLIVLDDPLFLGTVIGAAFILLGLYLVVWGQQAHRSWLAMQIAVPFSAVIGDGKEPLLSHSIEQ